MTGKGFGEDLLLPQLVPWSTFLPFSAWHAFAAAEQDTSHLLAQLVLLPRVGT